MDIKSFVLIKRDQQYLLIQEASFKWRGKWFLPGGNVKEGEPPEIAVLREAKEEAGCDVKLEGIFYIKCYRGLFNSKLHLFYCGSIIGDQIKKHEDKHSMGAQWFTYEEMSKLPLRQKMMGIVNAYSNFSNSLPTQNFKVITR
jgi:ADP-ribose pyrophosphatase YjhB (NUDIX family)